jgi:prevent-host-death family protein
VYIFYSIAAFILGKGHNMHMVAKHILKSKMREYFNIVETGGEDIVITDHSRPVAKIVPFKRNSSPEKVFARYRGKVRYSGDLCAPTSSEWRDK